MILLVLTLMLAFTLSLYGVPMARRAALKFGIVDSPDGRLKHQREPVPYLGGLAIYLAFLISLAFTFEFRHDVLGIVLAGTLVMMLGLIDDFGVLTPGIKLLGQLLAVFILIKSGIRIEIASSARVDRHRSDHLLDGGNDQCAQPPGYHGRTVRRCRSHQCDILVHRRHIER